jgi:hypothetical protein
MLNLGTTSSTMSTWYYTLLIVRCTAASLPAQLRDVDFSPDLVFFVIVRRAYPAGGPRSHIPLRTPPSGSRRVRSTHPPRR